MKKIKITHQTKQRKPKLPLSLNTSLQFARITLTLELLNSYDICDSAAVKQSLLSSFASPLTSNAPYFKKYDETDEVIPDKNASSEDSDEA